MYLGITTKTTYKPAQILRAELGWKNSSSFIHNDRMILLRLIIYHSTMVIPLRMVNSGTAHSFQLQYGTQCLNLSEILQSILDTVALLKTVECLMQLSVSSVTRSPLKGGKMLLPWTIIVYKNPPLRTKVRSLGHKVRKFHKCV